MRLWNLSMRRRGRSKGRRSEGQLIGGGLLVESAAPVSGLGHVSQTVWPSAKGPSGSWLCVLHSRVPTVPYTALVVALQALGMNSAVLL